MEVLAQIRLVGAPGACPVPFIADVGDDAASAVLADRGPEQSPESDVGAFDLPLGQSIQRESAQPNESRPVVEKVGPPCRGRTETLL